jgi:hypothetical protein
MDECELIALVTAVACGISKCCQEDDISIMAAVFTQLGDTLTTVLVKRESRENNKGNSGRINSGSDKYTNPVSTDSQFNNCTVYYTDTGCHSDTDTSNHSTYDLY